MQLQPGIYRHYKGPHYRVFGTVRHSESEEWLVLYQALYGDFGLWVRPLDMFCSTVEDSMHAGIVGQITDYMKKRKHCIIAALHLHRSNIALLACETMFFNRLRHHLCAAFDAMNSVAFFRQQATVFAGTGAELQQVAALNAVARKQGLYIRGLGCVIFIAI